LVTAYMRTKNLSPQVLVANHGAVMIFQHTVKIILFSSFFSFAISEYLFFIIVLAITGFAGAALGKRLISSISFDHFDILIKLLLSVLALTLVL